MSYLKCHFTFHKIFQRYNNYIILQLIHCKTKPTECSLSEMWGMCTEHIAKHTVSMGIDKIFSVKF